MLWSLADLAFRKDLHILVWSDLWNLFGVLGGHADDGLESFLHEQALPVALGFGYQGQHDLFVCGQDPVDSQ